jgi:two-component system sensor histidine kinase DegS
MNDALTVDEGTEQLLSEYEGIQTELRDINAKIDASRSELEKLEQRNAMISGQLRQIETNFETVPRANIRATYEAVRDSQQRLFTMRGQLDRLQAEQKTLTRCAELLKVAIDLLRSDGPSTAPQAAGEGPSAAISQATIERVVEAQEAERKRLAGQMHDGPAQSLTNFILQAEICQRLFDRDPERAREELDGLKAAASTTFQQVRAFIFDLRPMMLDDLGLLPTVERYAQDFQEKTGIITHLSKSGEAHRLEPHREVVAFRAVQELLANARDRSRATEVNITLEVTDAALNATVEDNGRGITTGQLEMPDEEHEALGLAALRERIGLVGGQLAVERSGSTGSKVTVVIPVSGVSE